MSSIILNDLHYLILTTVHEARTCFCLTLQMIRLTSLPEVALLESYRERTQYMHLLSTTCVLKLYLSINFSFSLHLHTHTLIFKYQVLEVIVD